jgi:hypothetical protein
LARPEHLGRTTLPVPVVSERSQCTHHPGKAKRNETDALQEILSHCGNSAIIADEQTSSPDAQDPVGGADPFVLASPSPPSSQVNHQFNRFATCPQYTQELHRRGRFDHGVYDPARIAWVLKRPQSAEATATSTGSRMGLLSLQAAEHTKFLPSCPHAVYLGHVPRGVACPWSRCVEVACEAV